MDERSEIEGDIAAHSMQADSHSTETSSNEDSVTDVESVTTSASSSYCTSGDGSVDSDRLNTLDGIHDNLAFGAHTGVVTRRSPNAQGEKTFRKHKRRHHRSKILSEDAATDGVVGPLSSPSTRPRQRSNSALGRCLEDSVAAFVNGLDEPASTGVTSSVGSQCQGQDDMMRGISEFDPSSIGIGLSGVNRIEEPEPVLTDEGPPPEVRIPTPSGTVDDDEEEDVPIAALFSVLDEDETAPHSYGGRRRIPNPFANRKGLGKLAPRSQRLRMLQEELKSAESQLLPAAPQPDAQSSTATAKQNPTPSTNGSESASAASVSTPAYPGHSLMNKKMNPYLKFLSNDTDELRDDRRTQHTVDRETIGAKTSIASGADGDKVLRKKKSRPVDYIMSNAVYEQTLRADHAQWLGHHNVGCFIPQPNFIPNSSQSVTFNGSFEESASHFRSFAAQGPSIRLLKARKALTETSSFGSADLVAISGCLAAAPTSGGELRRDSNSVSSPPTDGLNLKENIPVSQQSSAFSEERSLSLSESANILRRPLPPQFRAVPSICTWPMTSTTPRLSANASFDDDKATTTPSKMGEAKHSNTSLCRSTTSPACPSQIISPTSASLGITLVSTKPQSEQHIHTWSTNAATIASTNERPRAAINMFEMTADAAPLPICTHSSFQLAPVFEMTEESRGESPCERSSTKFHPDATIPDLTTASSGDVNRNITRETPEHTANNSFPSVRKPTASPLSTHHCPPRVGVDYLRSDVRPNATVSFCSRVAVVTSFAIASILTQEPPQPASTKAFRQGLQQAVPDASPQQHPSPPRTPIVVPMPQTNDARRAEVPVAALTLPPLARPPSFPKEHTIDANRPNVSADVTCHTPSLTDQPRGTVTFTGSGSGEVDSSSQSAISFIPYSVSRPHQLGPTLRSYFIERLITQHMWEEETDYSDCVRAAQQKMGAYQSHGLCHGASATASHASPFIRQTERNGPSQLRPNGLVQSNTRADDTSQSDPNMFSQRSHLFSGGFDSSRHGEAFDGSASRSHDCHTSGDASVVTTTAGEPFGGSKVPLARIASACLTPTMEGTSRSTPTAHMSFARAGSALKPTPSSTPKTACHKIPKESHPKMAFILARLHVEQEEQEAAGKDRDTQFNAMELPADHSLPARRAQSRRRIGNDNSECHTSDMPKADSVLSFADPASSTGMLRRSTNGFGSSAASTGDASSSARRSQGSPIRHGSEQRSQTLSAERHRKLAKRRQKLQAKRIERKAKEIMASLTAIQKPNAEQRSPGAGSRSQTPSLYHRPSLTEQTALFGVMTVHGNSLSIPPQPSPIMTARLRHDNPHGLATTVNGGSFAGVFTFSHQFQSHINDSQLRGLTVSTPTTALQVVSNSFSAMANSTFATRQPFLPVSTRQDSAQLDAPIPVHSPVVAFASTSSKKERSPSVVFTDHHDPHHRGPFTTEICLLPLSRWPRDALVEIPLFDGLLALSHAEQSAKPLNGNVLHFNQELQSSVCGFEERVRQVQAGLRDAAQLQASIPSSSFTYLHTIRRGYYVHTGKALLAALGADMIRMAGIATIDNETGATVDLAESVVATQMSPSFRSSCVPQSPAAADAEGCHEHSQTMSLSQRTSSAFASTKRETKPTRAVDVDESSAANVRRDDHSHARKPMTSQMKSSPSPHSSLLPGGTDWKSATLSIEDLQPLSVSSQELRASPNVEGRGSRQHELPDANHHSHNFQFLSSHLDLRSQLGLPLPSTRTSEGNVNQEHYVSTRTNATTCPYNDHHNVPPFRSRMLFESTPTGGHGATNSTLHMRNASMTDASEYYTQQEQPEFAAQED